MSSRQPDTGSISGVWPIWIPISRPESVLLNIHPCCLQTLSPLFQACTSLARLRQIPSGLCCGSLLEPDSLHEDSRDISRSPGMACRCHANQRQTSRQPTATRLPFASGGRGPQHSIPMTTVNVSGADHLERGQSASTECFSWPADPRGTLLTANVPRNTHVG